MSPVALIVVYNHQYNDNIEVVERIYGDRFSNIYHLVPFYTGNKKNVIPVYENSYYFQGYIAQGLKFIADERFAHYFFIADDLILNPVVTEKNYTKWLKIDANSSFLPGFIQLHVKRGVWWARVGEAYRWNLKTSGVEAVNFIPSYEDALLIFHKFGLRLEMLDLHQIWRMPKTIREVVITILRDSTYFIRAIFLWWKKYKLSYPLVGSYSDIFVVNSAAAENFALYCGVFASTRLHVEVAVPTAMVLSAEKIITEEELELKGGALWTHTEIHSLEEKFNFQLPELLTSFPSEKLYLHPVKLSKWKMTE